jgi:hypothetical protein
MSRNFIDELWRILPQCSATALEKDLCKVTPFDNIADPAVALLKRCKGDWLGWHLTEDIRGRPIFDENGVQTKIIDGSWYLVDNNGDLIVDNTGDPIVADPEYSRRFADTVNDTFLPWLQSSTASTTCLKFCRMFLIELPAAFD